MRARTLSTAALALGLAALAVWRGLCVSAGPDIDTDAYAHHMIARAILADPRDLAVHWVWLPLFHYAQVPLVALGGTMQDVRWINVVLTAASPVALFAYVRRTARAGPGGFSPDATALLAALFTALCPISMQMGTTAQPESLFAWLVLGVAITFQERCHALAAVLLGAAVLLRYEAWAVLAAAGAILLVELVRTARGRARVTPAVGLPERPSDRIGWRTWTVVAAPAALLLGWAALRRPVDGEWFGFLRETHQFASDALRQRSAFDGGASRIARDLSYYPLLVAYRVFAAALPLVPFGVVRTVRQQGARFVLVLAACLGFVSLTWLMHSSLGLDRHFVVVVPLYAVFAAQGAAALAEAVSGLVRRVRPAWAAVLFGRGVAGALAVAALVGLSVQTGVWMGFWRSSIERGWPDRVALAAYLRTLPGGVTIFCDEATLEILSGLDRSRFDRHWLDDPHTWELVASVAREQGVAYVATWTRKLQGHERAGEVVFRAGASRSASGAAVPPSAAIDAAEVEVMRVLPDAPRAQR